MTDQLAFTSPTSPTMGTQNSRVLAALLQVETVCGATFLDWYPSIVRYPARILDLKTLGWDIRKVKCPYSYHTHTKALASYQLVRTP